MTINVRVLSVLMVLVAGMVVAWGYPTLYGESGLVLVPTADLMPVATFDVAFNATRVGPDGGETKAFPVRVVFGGIQNTEVGAVLAETRGDAGLGYDVQGVSVKMGVVRENLDTQYPGVAIGARFTRFKAIGQDRLDVLEGYGVVSKTLLQRGDLVEEGYNIRAHLGVSYTGYTGRVDANFVRPFGGFSYTSASGNSGAIDYVPAQKDGNVVLREASVSAVLRRPLSKNFYAEIGTTRPFNMSETNQFYVGLMYHYTGFQAEL